MEIVSAGLDKEYAGIIGVPDFNSAAIKLALGEDSQVIKDKLVSEKYLEISLAYYNNCM